MITLTRKEHLAHLGAALLALRSEPGRLLLICPHVRGDGDAWGASLALWETARMLGVEAHIVASEPPPEQLAYMCEGTEVLVLQDAEATEAFVQKHPDRVVWMVDHSTTDRLAGRSGLVAGVAPEGIWVIDHHISDMIPHPLRLIDTSAAATCELVTEFLIGLYAEVGLSFTTSIALALYTGILTDTGRFTYPATSPATLRAAAHLLGYGVDTQFLSTHLFDTVSRSSLRLRTLLAQKLEFLCEGQAVIGVIDDGMMTEAGATQEDIEGLPPWLRNIEGVRVAALLRTEADGSIRGNLRSLPPIAVQPIAKSFGGGGHAQASGFTARGMTMEALVAQLRAAFRVVVEATSEGRE